MAPTSPLPLLKRLKSCLKRPSLSKSAAESCSPCAADAAAIDTPRPKLWCPQEELEAVFRRLDTDGDGLISWKELGAMLASLDGSATVNDAQLKAVLAETAKNSDGLLDLTEFLELNNGSDISDETRLQDLRNAFDIFDADRDGRISAAELQTVMNNLGEDCTLEDCQRMIKAVDGEGDGFVRFNEFLMLMAPSFRNP